MRFPASCSLAAHDPASAAGGKVCLVEDANGGREASLEFGQRSSAPVPPHSRPELVPNRSSHPAAPSAESAEILQQTFRASLCYPPAGREKAISYLFAPGSRR